jgi:hypothetical protein
MQRHSSFPTAFRCMTFAGLATVSAFAAEPEATPEARAHFKAGVAYLESNSRDEDAYREFEAAYAATPRWTILGHLGIAASRLERDGEAIDAMEGYLERGGAEVTAQEKARFSRSLERLRSGIATVTLEGPSPFWVMDTRTEPTGGTVVNEYGPFEGRAELRVRAGEHSFELTRSEAKTSSWPVALRPGDTATHAFEIAPDVVETFEVTAPEPIPAADPGIEHQSHTAAYLLWGVGALAVGATTVMYFESKGLKDQVDRAFPTSCPFGADPDDYECSGVLADDDRSANWRTAAAITGVGALGALVAGTVIYALDLKSSPAPAQTSQTKSHPTALRAWVSPTGLFVSGSF